MTVRRGLLVGLLALASLALSPLRADAGCTLVVVAGTYRQPVPANFGGHEVAVNSSVPADGMPILAVHGCVAIPAGIPPGPKLPDPFDPIHH